MAEEQCWKIPRDKKSFLRLLKDVGYEFRSDGDFQRSGKIYDKDNTIIGTANWPHDQEELTDIVLTYAFSNVCSIFKFKEFCDLNSVPYKEAPVNPNFVRELRSLAEKLESRSIDAAVETPQEAKPVATLYKPAEPVNILERKLKEDQWGDCMRTTHVRALNCFEILGIRTYGDLVKITEAELASVKGVGDYTLGAIKQRLAEEGLKLAEVAELAVTLRKPCYLDSNPRDDYTYSSHVLHGFKELGVNSYADLIKYTEDELMRVKRFGPKSLAEVKQKLAEKGLKLKQEVKQ